jgi:hypothetical protein
VVYLDEIVQILILLIDDVLVMIKIIVFVNIALEKNEFLLIKTLEMIF